MVLGAWSLVLGPFSVPGPPRLAYVVAGLELAILRRSPTSCQADQAPWT